MTNTKQTPTTEVAVRTVPGFQPQHQRFGGRKKRTAQMARDLADKLGCDPLEFLLKIVQADTYTQTVIGPDGKKQKREVAIDLATRIDAAKAVVGHFYPKLNSTAVTGSEGGPVESVHFDITKLMMNPDAVEAVAAWRLLLPEYVGDVIGAESASGGGLVDGAGHGVGTVLANEFEQFGDLAREGAIAIGDIAEIGFQRCFRTKSVEKGEQPVLGA